MKIKSTGLEGVFQIENKKLLDHRGIFIKTFHADTFKEHGLDSDFSESYYSISKKNVLRGMHFQLPPDDHAKLVYVIQGEILDVVVDVTKKSQSFGQYFSTNLSFDNARSLYIARGFAHGFLTLSESATVVYLTTTVHAPESDSGIKWNSFGFDWMGVKPIVSDRDDKLSGIKDI